MAWDRRFGRNPEAGLKGFGKRKSGGKIRVGFISPTFHHHANCEFLLPLLEAMDGERFELFAYHDGATDDGVTARCRAAVGHFRNINRLPEKKCAEIIRRDRIDVLIDINGHFDNSRLRILAHRPARVQVHYLGGTGSTGARFIDWRISDDLIEPENSLGGDTGNEKIHRISGGMHVYHPLAKTVDPDESPFQKNGYITFGSLNSQMKMEPPVLRLWARCLKAVPGSRLRIVKEIFSEAGVRDDFMERAVAEGMPEEQLDLVPGAGISSYNDLSVYHGIDISLDTFPYNGITTTCQSLWMGVPVVALRGDRFVSREAAAIISRVGFHQWVAAGQDEYVEIAKGLSAQPEVLASLRKDLRVRFQNSPLHDADRLARAFEDFLISVV